MLYATEELAPSAPAVSSFYFMMQISKMSENSLVAYSDELLLALRIYIGILA